MKKILRYGLVIAAAGLLAVGIYRIAERPKVQDYSDPQIPVGKYDELVSVDVVRSGDDIWVVDHRSGHLVFELSRKKKTDAGSLEVFEGLLEEASGNEVDGKSSVSYRSK